MKAASKTLFIVQLLNLSAVVGPSWRRARLEDTRSWKETDWNAACTLFVEHFWSSIAFCFFYNFPIPGELHCQFLNCFLLTDAQCHPRRVTCIWTAWKRVCIGWESLSVGKYITKSTTLQYSKFSVKLRLQSGVVSWRSNDRIVIPVIVQWCWLEVHCLGCTCSWIINIL